MNSEDKYYKILFKLALKAYKKNEVPVASIVVRNGEIISKAYNKRHNTHNPLNHAEIIAIKTACKRLKTWKLDDCDIYVTLKPCKMCCEVIKQARIHNVYFFTDNTKDINFKTNFIKLGDKDKTFSKLLTFFFEKLR